MGVLAGKLRWVRVVLLVGNWCALVGVVVLWVVSHLVAVAYSHTFYRITKHDDYSTATVKAMGGRVALEVHRDELLHWDGFEHGVPWRPYSDNKWKYISWGDGNTWAGIKVNWESTDHAVFVPCSYLVLVLGIWPFFACRRFFKARRNRPGFPVDVAEEDKIAATAP